MPKYVKKYELTQQKMTLKKGLVLHRIRALRDFDCIKKGDLGGWVESESNLATDYNLAWVAGEAKVYGYSAVSDCARAGENAQVYGDARIIGNATIAGKTQVFDKATVSGRAVVNGKARIFGEAMVYGDVLIFGNAEICGDAVVRYKERIGGDVRIEKTGYFPDRSRKERAHADKMRNGVRRIL